MEKPEEKDELISVQSVLTIVGFVCTASLIIGITTAKLDAEVDKREMADASIKEYLQKDIQYMSMNISKIEQSICEIKSMIKGFHNEK